MSPIDPPLIDELAAALARLESGAPQIVRAPYKINNKTVSEEAGRHRSTIKTTEAFEQIRSEIARAEAKRIRGSSGERKLRQRIRDLERQKESLKAEKSELATRLQDAGTMLFRIYRQLAELEDQNEYILSKIDEIRRKDHRVNEAFEIASFDQLIELK